MNAFTDGITQFLEAALAEGFELPWHLAAVGANGTLTFMRYSPSNGENADEGLTAQFLAQHREDSGFKLPINVMLTDSTGQAARMLIQRPGDPEFFWPHTLSSL